MKRVELLASQMTDKEALHDVLARELELPEWYGRNLDALYDMLSTCPPLRLTLVNAKALNAMFRYGDNLRLTLEDAARDNPHLELIFED